MNIIKYKINILILINILFVSPSLLAEVFKWVDENGKIHFGDKPLDNSKSEKIDIKGINTVKKIDKDPLGGTYKRDFFVMPARKSTIPYRFFLASKMKGRKPADRLKKIKVNEQQKNFIIYVDLPGVERFEEYKLRSRIIDAKGELVFDKTASATSANNSMFFYNVYHPKVTTDEPGTWIFQGILNGRKLYVEKKIINFKKLVNNDKSKTKSNKTTLSGEFVKLPDGTKFKTPKSVEELNELQRKLNIHSDSDGSVQIEGVKRLACPVKKNGNCEGKQLIAADYSDLSIYNMSFDLANLKDANFFRTKLYSKTSFKNAILINADFSHARLDGVDFTGANLTGANFTNVDCRSCIFDESIFKDVIFSTKRSGKASFQRARLQDVKFNKSKTLSGDFQDAEITNVDLSFMDVRAANFENATLKNVVLDDTKLKISNLLKANIDKCSACKERIDKATIDVALLKEDLAQADINLTNNALYRENGEEIKKTYELKRKIIKQLNLIMSGEAIISNEDLVNVLFIMFTNNDPSYYIHAFNIIEKHYKNRLKEDKYTNSLCSHGQLRETI